MTLDQPAENQIEVTVFGTGYGESILVHMGEQQWLCVDSCLHPETGRAAALSYLNDIGVSPKAISIVVATHWDTDHIRGLNQILSEAINADFVVSAAFHEKEFRALLAPHLANGKSIANSSTQEISQVLEMLKKTGRRVEIALKNSCLTIEDDKVRALSPSDKAVVSTIARLRDDKPGTYRRSLSKIHSNDSSIALLVKVSGRRIILGADLETRADREIGWLSVVDLLGGQPKAEAFKIAHHGAPNGDHEEIWEKLLLPNVHSVMTSFVKGGVYRPSGSDQDRIKDRTNRLWLTTNPSIKKIKDLQLSSEVQRTLKESTVSLKVIPKKFGIVRMRSNIESRREWQVDAFHDAVSLN